MANRYPLVVDTTNGNKIKEIPNGDNLQLTGNSVIGAIDITASGTVSANEVNATSIKKGGTELANVAVTGAFSDLTGGPTQLSDLTDDLNVLVPGDNVGTLTNNVGYLTTVAFSDLTATPTTLAGYGITDAATLAQGGLASTAVQPGASVSVLTNDAGYVTSSQLTDGSLTVDVNNSGDLIGSVFGDDSTMLVDSILSAINLDGTVRGNVVPAVGTLYDIGTTSEKFKNAHFSGDVNANRFVGDGSGLTGITGANFEGAYTFSIGADDSTGRVVNDGEQINILGGTAITTASDAEGNITITGVAQDFAFSSITGTPTTISGYGITDAFDGVFGSLTSTPTTISGYGITDAQSTLVSGTSIKTINNTSLLGSGNITVAGDTGNITFTGTTIDSDDSSGIEFTPAVTMNSDLTVENDLRVTNVVYATSFESDSVGAPTFTSDSSINLSANDRVTINKSPLNFASFTDTERDALTAVNGDMIYNTTNNRPEMYVNGAWKIIDTSPIV
jgi:hypothetical protein